MPGRCVVPSLGAVGQVHVFRYEDGDAASSFAEVAVRADHVGHALELLLTTGLHVEQLWDRGRTPCAAADLALDQLAEGEVAVRRHHQDGGATGWEAPRSSLDRRRQTRNRAATSTAQ